MIYTVTFNPSLDYLVTVDDFKLGLTNRTSSERLVPGGKGLNVSMVLGTLGLENTAFGFAAGFTGAEIVRMCLYWRGAFQNPCRRILMREFWPGWPAGR